MKVSISVNQKQDKEDLKKMLGLQNFMEDYNCSMHFDMLPSSGAMIRITLSKNQGHS